MHSSKSMVVYALLAIAAITLYPPFYWTNDRLEQRRVPVKFIEGTLPLKQRAFLFGDAQADFSNSIRADESYSGRPVMLHRRLAVSDLALEYVVAVIVAVGGNNRMDATTSLTPIRRVSVSAISDLLGYRAASACRQLQ